MVLLLNKGLLKDFTVFSQLTPFSRLPNELLFQIISYLSLQDRTRVREVSKAFLTLTDDNCLWAYYLNKPYDEGHFYYAEFIMALSIIRDIAASQELADDIKRQKILNHAKANSTFSAAALNYKTSCVLFLRNGVYFEQITQVICETLCADIAKQIRQKAYSVSAAVSQANVKRWIKEGVKDFNFNQGDIIAKLEYALYITYLHEKALKASSSLGSSFRYLN